MHYCYVEYWGGGVHNVFFFSFFFTVYVFGKQKKKSISSKNKMVREKVRRILAQCTSGFQMLSLFCFSQESSKPGSTAGFRSRMLCLIIPLLNPLFLPLSSCDLLGEWWVVGVGGVWLQNRELLPRWGPQQGASFNAQLHSSSQTPHFYWSSCDLMALVLLLVAAMFVLNLFFSLLHLIVIFWHHSSWLASASKASSGLNRWFSTLASSLSLSVSFSHKHTQTILFNIRFTK